MGQTLRETIGEVWDFASEEFWQGSPAPIVSSATPADEFPSCLEGALLLLHYLRNCVVNPFQSSRAQERLAPAAFDAWKGAIDDWLGRVSAMAARLKTLDRAAAVTESDRAGIRSFFDETETLALSRGGGSMAALRLDWRILPLAQRASLATLPLDRPEIVEAHKDDVARPRPAARSKHLA